MFQFKQFTICQDRTPMKVGTDGVLLGAWLDLCGAERHILDIGSGTGLIALMMAQRSAAQIDGVEIDQQSAEQASENVAASPWSDRVVIHCCAIQDFDSVRRYDLILSNPPYFVDSLLSPDSRRSAARHTTTLNFNDLAREAERRLTSEGRFGVILPATEALLFDRAAADVGLHLLRRARVRSHASGAVKRIMSEYSRTKCATPLLEQLTISTTERNYTDEYRNLTRDFYLKF